MAEPEGSDGPVVIRYATDERVAPALAHPAHPWLSARQATWSWRFFLGVSLWAGGFGVRAVMGPTPGWVEGFVVGVALYGWAVVWTHLRVRVQGRAGAPIRVTLTLHQDWARLEGVGEVQRFSRGAVTHWTDGAGWVVLHLRPILLPVDVERIPQEQADALRRWLHGEPRCAVEKPERGDLDLEYVRSRAVFMVWHAARTHAERWNLVVFGLAWVVAVFTFQVGLLIAVVVGWNLGLIVHLLWMSRYAGAPRVLSLDPGGLRQRGAEGWFMTPWSAVQGAARLPGLGWVIRTRHGDHPIGRHVQGDVAGFVERVRRQGLPRS